MCRSFGLLGLRPDVDHRLLVVVDEHVQDHRAVHRSTGKEWSRCPSRLLVGATKSVELAAFIVNAKQLELRRPFDALNQARRPISPKPLGMHDHMGHVATAQKANRGLVGKRLQTLGRVAVGRRGETAVPVEQWSPMDSGRENIARIAIECGTRGKGKLDDGSSPRILGNGGVDG